MQTLENQHLEVQHDFVCLEASEVRVIEGRPRSHTLRVCVRCEGIPGSPDTSAYGLSSQGSGSCL
jgi:hypothetical protein